MSRWAPSAAKYSKTFPPSNLRSRLTFYLFLHCSSLSSKWNFHIVNPSALTTPSRATGREQHLHHATQRQHSSWVGQAEPEESSLNLCVNLGYSLLVVSKYLSLFPQSNSTGLIRACSTLLSTPTQCNQLTASSSSYMGYTTPLRRQTPFAVTRGVKFKQSRERHCSSWEGARILVDIG